MLPTLENEEILYKWKAFERIKIMGDYGAEMKEMLYSRYSEYASLNPAIIIPPSKLVQPLTRFEKMSLERKLKYIDNVFAAAEKKLEGQSLKRSFKT